MTILLVFGSITYDTKPKGENMRWLPDNMYRSQWLVNEKINEILNDIDNGEPISETFKFLLYGSLFKERTYDVPAFLLNDDKKRQKIINVRLGKVHNKGVGVNIFTKFQSA